VERLYRTASVSLSREGIDDPAILNLIEEIEKELRVIIGQVAGAPADSYTDETIPTAALEDGAVTTVKLDADAVDDTKLADNAVGNEHLQDDAVDTAELADGAVDADRLDTDAVTKVKVNAEAIGRAELDTSENTFSHTFPGGGGQWTTGPITGGYVFWPDIYSDTALTPYLIAQTTATPADSDNPYISLIDLVGGAVIGGSHRQVDA
jgi:hypothetical protein